MFYSDLDSYFTAFQKGVLPGRRQEMENPLLSPTGGLLRRWLPMPAPRLLLSTSRPPVLPPAPPLSSDRRQLHPTESLLHDHPGAPRNLLSVNLGWLSHLTPQTTHCLHFVMVSAAFLLWF